MVLQEFVSKSLRDILGAISEVQTATPDAIPMNNNTAPDFVKLGVTHLQSVEFEVLVRAEEKSGSEAKLNVVAAVLGGGVKGESGKAEGHSATLRFRVPINLRAIHHLTKNTPLPQ